jgi:hypothetical protein
MKSNNKVFWGLKSTEADDLIRSRVRSINDFIAPIDSLPEFWIHEELEYDITDIKLSNDPCFDLLITINDSLVLEISSANMIVKCAQCCDLFCNLPAYYTGKDLNKYSSFLQEIISGQREIPKCVDCENDENHKEDEDSE